jgi:hypothetical protein
MSESTTPEALAVSGGVLVGLGLVALMFDTRHLGMVFLGHRIGAFAAALLGGVIDDRAGDYDLMWVLCIVLSVGTALVQLPIHERRARGWAPGTA